MTEKVIMKIFILLTTLAINAYGFVDPMEDIPLEIFTEHPEDEEISKKVVAAYCIDQNGSAPETLKEVKYTSEVNCKFGRSSLFFYEAWNSKNPSIDSTDLKMSSLEPKLNDIEKKYFNLSIAIQLLKAPDCKIEVKEEPPKVYRSCANANNGNAEDITGLVVAKLNEPGFEDIVATRINNHGKASFQSLYGENKKPQVQSVVPEVKNDIVDPKPAVQIKDKKIDLEHAEVSVKKVLVFDHHQPKRQEQVNTEPNTLIKNAEEKDEVIDLVKDDPKPDQDCNEELNKEIAALLTDDKKNIIGLQYELTVLKIAALATESKTNSIEGLIKQQAKKIESMDEGIINKMNIMYKQHGLPEDAATISLHLKKKTSTANYFAKDKRFFNQDSSAFLLAYQGINEKSGIKDSDVSVLWFMDKVSEKAMEQNGKYSAAHNLTNLSTRIAQYTSAIDPKKALSKLELDEMARKQNGKIEDEFLELIQKFKTSNPACYAIVFSDGEADTQCNINVVEAGLSQLLAINSRIQSTDLVSIDSKFHGRIDKTRFLLSKYVDAPEKTREKPVAVKKEEVKENDLPDT